MRCRDDCVRWNLHRLNYPHRALTWHWNGRLEWSTFPSSLLHCFSDRMSVNSKWKGTYQKQSPLSLREIDCVRFQQLVDNRCLGRVDTYSSSVTHPRYADNSGVSLLEVQEFLYTHFWRPHNSVFRKNFSSICRARFSVRTSSAAHSQKTFEDLRRDTQANGKNVRFIHWCRLESNPKELPPPDISNGFLDSQVFRVVPHLTGASCILASP